MSSFHPNVSKQLPPPQCLGFVLFSPQCFETAASTPMFGFCPLFTRTLLSHRAGSDVEATSLPCQHRAKQKRGIITIYPNLSQNPQIYPTLLKPRDLPQPLKKLMRSTPAADMAKSRSSVHRRGIHGGC